MPTHIASVTLETPSGPFVVAATDRGVVAAGWLATDDALHAELRARLGPLGPPTETARAILETARPALERMLQGEAADATGIPLDLRDRSAFDRHVLAAVREVPWGHTASYGAIARRIGAPRAARAVGGAIARNPISMIVPCHRIIASDGTLGGYGGTGWFDRDRALSRKEALLAREGVTVPRRSD
jgi:methylated-DNA-[protein]-cysteine S-methyltransferase